jgi:hypothetical protein
MAAIKHNLKLTEQADWKYSVEATAEGADANASMVYEDSFDGALGRLPTIGMNHPNIPGLLCYKADVERQEGGKAKITLSFKPYSWEATYPGRPENPPKKSYSIDVSTREEPLLTHVIFAELDEAERDALAAYMASNKDTKALSVVEKAVTSETGLLALAKIKKGVESYFSPGIVWVEKFKTTTPSEIELASVGNSTNSPPGNPPSAGDNRDWLYLGASGSMQEDGETWEFERRWQLSERGKWDEDLYGTTPA